MDTWEWDSWGRGKSPRRNNPRREGTGGNTQEKKRKSRKRKWTIDINEMLSIVIPEIVNRLGLDHLNLSDRELREVIEPIVVGIIESRKTKPTAESIVKRITNSKYVLFKALAAKLIEREDLSLEQLEFIVSYAPELAGRASPKLYHIAKKLNADYVIDTLRYLWQRYGKATRIRCPYCGFYSVTPDLTCMVCGTNIDEEDLKESIEFREQLKKLVELGYSELVEEILRAGFVIYDGELYPPSLRSRHPFGVVLYLSKRERELLRQLLAARKEL